MKELVSLVQADVRRARDIYGSYFYCLHPGVVAVIGFRIAHYLDGLGGIGRLLSRLVWLANFTLTGADLHSRAQIGPGLFIPHTQGMGFGEFTTAGKNLTLYALVIIGKGPDLGSPTIGDDVTFWTKASAFGGLTIGDGAHVGAHALLFSDVPSGWVASGNPAVAQPRRRPTA